MSKENKNRPIASITEVILLCTSIHSFEALISHLFLRAISGALKPLLWYGKLAQTWEDVVLVNVWRGLGLKRSRKNIVKESSMCGQDCVFQLGVGTILWRRLKLVLIKTWVTQSTFYRFFFYIRMLNRLFVQINLCVLVRRIHFNRWSIKRNFVGKIN